MEFKQRFKNVTKKYKWIGVLLPKEKTFELKLSWDYLEKEWRDKSKNNIKNNNEEMKDIDTWKTYDPDLCYSTEC